MREHLAIQLPDSGETVTADVILSLPMLGHKVASWMPTGNSEFVAVAVVHGIERFHRNIEDAVAQVLTAGAFNVPGLVKAQRRLFDMAV